MRSESFDVAIIDLNYARDTTSGREGLDLLPQIQAIDPSLPVIVMTAWATIDVAVEAMRRGARDFLEKPWDNHRVLSVVSNQVSLQPRGAPQPPARSRESVAARGGDEDFIAEVAGDACRDRYGGARRAFRCVRAHHRRERHGQGRSSRGSCTSCRSARDIRSSR